MSILFKDATQMKLILQKKASEGLNWNKYLEKYLDPTEIEKLNKTPKSDTNKPEKIAAMLFSEAPPIEAPQVETPPIA